MSIVIDALSDIFLCIVDMIFSRKSDKRPRADKRSRADKRPRAEREGGKEACHGQSK